MEAIQADIKATVDALAASNRAELQGLAAALGQRIGASRAIHPVRLGDGER